MFFSNILHLARASDFAAGPFRALAHVCRAPRPRAHARPHLGWRHPYRVPYPGLPSLADLRPASLAAIPSQNAMAF